MWKLLFKTAGICEDDRHQGQVDPPSIQLSTIVLVLKLLLDKLLSKSSCFSLNELISCFKINTYTSLGYWVISSSFYFHCEISFYLSFHRNSAERWSWDFLILLFFCKSLFLSNVQRFAKKVWRTTKQIDEVPKCYQNAFFVLNLNSK